MGEVYRAIDTNLKRGVAIKVLPTLVAADAERLARFQREAEVLAALNHPNIAAIYGVERSSATTALVMELIDGPTLADRIAQGALPVDESLPTAKQIAEALEAAHERGIIHRDLKPANIKVRADGVVKVLDFGLAKAMEPTSAISAGTSMSPTITTPALTQSGMILGTAAYMSPEQARGKTADKRADVWAFGAVLFEMLTGKLAFPGENITDTIVSVVSKEPDWRTLPAATPAGLRQLLARSLKKDPRARLQSIGDARVQIEELLSGAPDETLAEPGVPAAGPAAWPRSAWSRALPWTLAASALVFAVTSVLWAPWRGASPSPTALRFTPFAFEQGGQSNPVWAPDGKAVAFAARQNDTDPFQVYVRYLDSPLATPITHLAVDAIPIGWTATGRIVFRSAQAPAGLWSVSPVGGEPQPFQTMEASIGPAPEASTASASRDGSALAWLHRGDDGLIGLWISSPPGSAPKRYEPAPFAARFSTDIPTVKFSHDGTQILLVRNAGDGDEAWLMPYPANAADPPRRILQDLPLFTTTFSWMPNNRHVVLSTAPGLAPQQLYMADTVSGAVAVLSSGTTPQRSPAVSPDGSKLVFVEAVRDFDIVSMNLANADVAPLIATRGNENQPAWAARESAMVYVTDRGGLAEIWLHKAGQLDRPLVSARDFPPDTTATLMTPTLSPDALRVIYMRLERAGPGRLWISAVAGGSPVQLVNGSAQRERAGSWSPDGKWFVYTSHSKDGRSSLNKVNTTGQAEAEVLKADINPIVGNWLPVWSPSGDWILYDDRGVKLISPDGKTTRHLSSTTAVAYTFSSDARTIYGIRRAAADRLELFSMSVAGGTEKTIGSFGREHLPVTLGGPATRLSLTPDGKSITFSTSKDSSKLWLIELNGVTPR